MLGHSRLISGLGIPPHLLHTVGAGPCSLSLGPLSRLKLEHLRVDISGPILDPLYSWYSASRRLEFNGVHPCSFSSWGLELVLGQFLCIRGTQSGTWHKSGIVRNLDSLSVSRLDADVDVSIGSYPYQKARTSGGAYTSSLPFADAGGLESKTSLPNWVSGHSKMAQ